MVCASSPSRIRSPTQKSTNNRPGYLQIMDGVAMGLHDETSVQRLVDNDQQVGVGIVAITILGNDRLPCLDHRGWEWVRLRGSPGDGSWGFRSVPERARHSFTPVPNLHTLQFGHLHGRGLEQVVDVALAFRAGCEELRCQNQRGEVGPRPGTLEVPKEVAGFRDERRREVVQPPARAGDLVGHGGDGGPDGFALHGVGVRAATDRLQ
ncbi:hypothetical protein PGQ11_010629 [Apiospora arundinis]|uniref:Uncharacterized protein n=1 Tax=Apiospora arundinis TaxID=335852 RepID=A0ABR2IB56_9PEZI